MEAEFVSSVRVRGSGYMGRVKGASGSTPVSIMPGLAGGDLSFRVRLQSG